VANFKDEFHALATAFHRKTTGNQKIVVPLARDGLFLFSTIMKTKIFLILVALAWSVSAVSAQSSADLILEPGVLQHKGLDEIYRNFSKGYLKLDAALVAGLYGETAAYLVPGDDIKIGREKILADFTRFFDSVKKSNEKIAISFRIFQRQADANLAYDVGVYTLVSTNEKGESRQGKGKFVVVARREKDGLWRFQVDGYSDLPKPPDA